ncbi:hypothetical protein NXS19_008397 [Fusarium pseudograminearum]|nr:hypothetical protein NXS19_008397 [Fusarium pseudograminearum]
MYYLLSSSLLLPSAPLDNTTLLHRLSIPSLLSIERSRSLNMSRHFVPLVLAVLFSALANAEPCKPNEVINGVEIFTTTTTTTTATAQVTHSCVDNQLSPLPKTSSAA